MKRKLRLLTNEVYKHKARLNVHGSQQEQGINYWETYTPVVTWAAIRLVLVFVLMFKWHTKQIDCVLAYPQASVECDIYMKIPKDFTMDGKTQKHTCLKVNKEFIWAKAGRECGINHYTKTCQKLDGNRVRQMSAFD
jgi:Reverse transcriptase (RNA-dependent DNA polymerase)